jgi:hypothetical protein
MVLRTGFIAVAAKLQEAADSGYSLSAGDVRSRLNDAIQDQYRGTGKWASYIDHFGDDKSGDVIYSCDGETWRCPYEMSSTSGAAKCILDCDHAEDVVPRTIYEPEAEEADHYAAMEESYKRDKLYGSLPVYERFVSKSERDAASSSDFAGKGKSFPILKAADVKAAASSMGRAGTGNYSTDVIRKNIIRIAKAKGWASELPKAWQDGGTDSAKESARASAQSSAVNLVESAATVEKIVIREAKADYEIKLIAPGKGASAFYPSEVLKRDGPKVFVPGTHVYVNHPTAAEEAARPEGDVKNLAGVLTTSAEYHESHAKGPGLYARMKVFADHSQMVEEKAPHVGMSIRASGMAESGRKQEGLPVLKELTSAESVDVVTKAGAGGMILTEAAKSAAIQTQEAAMTADEAKKLVEAAVATATAPLRERALRGDAREEATRLLESISLPGAAKTRIIERSIATLPTTAEGALDVAKFREAVVAEAKAEGEYIASITGSGKVFGMGSAVRVAEALKPEQIAAREAAAKSEEAESIKVWESLGMTPEAAKLAYQGRAN